MPSIQYLVLRCGWHLILDSNVFKYLLTRSGLRALCLGIEIPWNLNLMHDIDLDTIVAAGNLLPDLQYLSVTADEAPLVLILSSDSIRKNIHAVELDIITPAAGAASLDKLFRPLSACVELREISLDHNCIPVLESGDALLSVAMNCHHLRTMNITAAETTSLTDNLIEMLASKLPYLEVFDFQELPVLRVFLTGQLLPLHGIVQDSVSSVYLQGFISPNGIKSLIQKA